MALIKRTHTCGELTLEHDTKEVALNGWVHTRRDHGGVIFVDLRDRYGLTQVVFNPDTDFFSEAEKLRREDVIAIKGKVRPRPEGMENPNLVTGKVEVLCEELQVLNKSEVPPMEIDDRIDPGEEVRLKHRYLDLRRPKVQNGIVTRHKMLKSVRDYFCDNKFLEIETPILAKSTPEGARDFLVPSRVHPGKFFALPQSPQLFKQILMVSGMDRYFQIARCFRDEDLRQDRQPEFTQIDVEMSFVEVDDIISMIEGLLVHIWKEVKGIDIKTPFRRMSYEEAISKYGTDKPDLRYGMEIVDLAEDLKDCGFEVFASAAKNGGVVAINAKGCAEMSRADIDNLISFAQAEGAKGLAWMKVKEGKLESSIVKFFDEKDQEKIMKNTEATDGDLLLFMADDTKVKACELLGKVRMKIAQDRNMADPDSYVFSWTVDFPLFEWSDTEQRLMSVHHPFTSPLDEDLELLDADADISKAKSKAYDVVLNGQEIGGGSIRIHRPDVQQKIFNVLGINEDRAKKKFGFLLEAFKYGAPPHGGIALGVDRLASILAGHDAIRDVIAFPKTKNAESLMDDAPNVIDEDQLPELGIELTQEVKARLRKDSGQPKKSHNS